MRQAMVVLGYAHEDDDKWHRLPLTSRDMLAVERRVKGFTANGYFSNVSMGDSYKVAFIVLRDVRKELPEDMTLGEFERQYYLKLRDPDLDDGDDQEDDKPELAEEADPTRTTA